MAVRKGSEVGEMAVKGEVLEFVVVYVSPGISAVT
jgi:hypothetical protein